MGYNNRFTDDEDAYAIEYIDRTMEIAGVPEEHWDELRELTMDLRNKGWGIRIHDLIHMMDFERLAT